MGALLPLLRRPPLSGRAQIWPWDQKTKLFPSAVHLPQHSLGGLCQPASKGCRFVPWADTSQSDRAPVLGSYTYNRSRPPSGDHAGLNAEPTTETSLRDSVPSLLARNKWLPLVKASALPSGDQAPSLPT